MLETNLHVLRQCVKCGMEWYPWLATTKSLLAWRLERDHILSIKRWECRACKGAR